MAEPAPSGPLTLLRPLLLLSYSGYFIPHAVVKVLLSFNPSPFFNPSAFKSIWFARFWQWFGPRARENAEASVLPLLQNSASGVCLDVGPGSGQWLYMFAKAENPSITKIYGVEPNAGMHAELRKNAIKAGLEDIYEIVACGAEELGTKADIAKESVDTIITVQCLCSIPDPENVINQLYPYLKSAGKWLVYEHVRTPYQQQFVAFWQRAINIIWPHFFGGCDITRPTDEWLLRAGEWKEVDLHFGKGEGPYDTIPHSIGTLTKA